MQEPTRSIIPQWESCDNTLGDKFAIPYNKKFSKNVQVPDTACGQYDVLLHLHLHLNFVKRRCFENEIELM